jgi:hypothetical protein
MLKTPAQKKRAGRPAVLADATFIGLRLPGPLVQAIDAWAAEHGANRSGAVRQLLGAGLKGKVRKLRT